MQNWITPDAWKKGLQCQEMPYCRPDAKKTKVEEGGEWSLGRFTPGFEILTRGSRLGHETMYTIT